MTTALNITYESPLESLLQAIAELFWPLGSGGAPTALPERCCGGPPTSTTAPRRLDRHEPPRPSARGCPPSRREGAADRCATRTKEERERTREVMVVETLPEIDPRAV